MLIKKWGRSSAASTAVSIADAMKSLVTPTKVGDWFSSGVSFIVLPLKLPSIDCTHHFTDYQGQFYHGMLISV